MRTTPSSYSARTSSGGSRTLVRALFAGLAYLVALLVSFQFVGGAAHEANVWIASGIAIGVLSLAEVGRWPLYAGAIAGAAIVGNLLDGASLVESAVYTAAELASAAVTAWLLQRATGAPPRLDTVGRALRFVAVGVLGGALLGLAFGALAYALLGLPSPLGLWKLWLVSTGVGTLVMAPLLFAWSRFRARRSGGATTRDFAWGAGFFLLLVGSTLFVFSGNTSERFSGSVGHALTYLPLPFLVLGSIVWGARGATLATFALSAIAVVYTASGQGPFASIDAFPEENVLEVQGYVAAAALLTLLLTALNLDRQRALHEAGEWKLRYEAVIGASDQLLYELDPVTGRMQWAGDTLRVLGLSPEGLHSLAAYLERVHPDDREPLRAALLKLGSGEQKRAGIAHRVVSPSGQERLLESEANAIIDFDDSVHRVVGFVHPLRPMAASRS
jgi:integral membrane sensor domain MASE1